MKTLAQNQALIIKALKEKLEFINGYNLYCKEGIEAQDKPKTEMEKLGFNFSILANSKK